MKSINEIIETGNGAILDDQNCFEFFNEIEDNSNKVDCLVNLINECKFRIAENADKAQTYQEASDLWEQRLQALQRYGIRLLNETKMKSLESEEYHLGLEQEIPTLKCSLTRHYETKNMIPDELIFSIPEVYRKPKVIWEMRDELVKNVLLSGKKLNFAKLNDKQRLLILNKTEEQYVTNE